MIFERCMPQKIEKSEDDFNISSHNGNVNAKK